MALEWDETCLDVSVSDYDPDSIVQLQALCRGWLVRKKLKDLQTEFQQIVLELDGPTTQVEWTDSALPHPVICKLSKKSRKNQDQVPTRKLSNESKQNSVKRTDRAIESDCPKCAVQKTAVGNSRTESTERSAQSVTPKPDSDNIQSDQQVQTDFTQTNQQRLTSESTQKEDDSCQVPVTDKQQLRRDVGGGEDHRVLLRDSGDTDSLTVLKNLRAENEKNEHRVITDKDAERGSTRGPILGGSEAVTSLASVRSSATNIVSSDGVAAISGPGSESSGVRRVDSFYGDQTSVWDSSSSVVQETGAKRFQGQHSHHDTTAAVVRDQGGGSLEMGAGVKEEKLRSLSTEDLLKQRQNVAMELLWVQQAIISRKKYLKLKLQMEGAA